MKSPSDSFLHAGLEARCMGTIQGAFKNVNSQATPGDSNSVGFGGAQEFLLLTNSGFFCWSLKHREVAWRG